MIVSDAEPVFPAPSVQDPVSFTPVPSGPEYVPAVHELMPEGPPSPLKLAATGLVYQPFASGAREIDPVTAGGVESFRTVTEYERPSAPYINAHVTV